MSYAFDVDNSSNYTKPSREYGVLGVNYNQNLVPLIANNPWPAMDTQYLAYPNAPRTYYSLTKDNNGQPYATISSGYPGACSYYNIVKCPTNEVTRPFPPDPQVANGCGTSGRMVVAPQGPAPGAIVPLGTPTPGAIDSCGASVGDTGDQYNLIRFMNQNHFILFADEKTAPQVLGVFPPSAQAFIEVKNPSDPSVKAELAQRGITSTPALLSSSSGRVYSQIPPSFATVQQFFAGGEVGTTIPIGTATPSPVVTPVYVAVVRASCPFCVSLIRDVETSPLRSQFFFIDESDTATIQQYLGASPPAIAGYPFIYNTATRKSVTGYNSTRGLATLIQYLQ